MPAFPCLPTLLNNSIFSCTFCSHALHTHLVHVVCTLSFHCTHTTLAEAGEGQITCRIGCLSDDDVDIDILDNGDGTVSVVYTPNTAGEYAIEIKFGGKPVPGGSFVQKVRHLSSQCYLGGLSITAFILCGLSFTRQMSANLICIFDLHISFVHSRVADTLV